MTDSSHPKSQQVPLPKRGKHPMFSILLIAGVLAFIFILYQGLQFNQKKIPSALLEKKAQRQAQPRPVLRLHQVRRTFEKKK